MSNTRCEILPWILLPVFSTACVVYILPSLELQLMYLLAAIALATHIHYGSCVVSTTHTALFSVQLDSRTFLQIFIASLTFKTLIFIFYVVHY
jgi:hypothetical protein